MNGIVHLLHDDAQKPFLEVSSPPPTAPRAPGRPAGSPDDHASATSVVDVQIGHISARRKLFRQVPGSHSAKEVILLRRIKMGNVELFPV
jgi:hypothetical protein